MGEIDNRILKLFGEEEMFLDEVVQGDSELLFLDTYLADIFKFKDGAES